jgi:hypothetical protein
VRRRVALAWSRRARGERDRRWNSRGSLPVSEQRGQSEHYAIESGEIRSAMAGAIANEQLMLQQQRLPYCSKTPPDMPGRGLTL